MKLYLLSVLASAWEPECPSESGSTSITSHHVPGVCTQFYYCFNGATFDIGGQTIQECSTGQAFDGNGSCDWVEIVDCGAAWRQVSQVDCSSSANCNASRDACGNGSLFQGATQEADLLTCLNSFMGKIEFNGRTFTIKSIQRSHYRNEALQFYEELNGDEFIYLDNLYNTWRIGGSNQATRTIDCATLPICE